VRKKQFMRRIVCPSKEARKDLEKTEMSDVGDLGAAKELLTFAVSSNTREYPSEVPPKNTRRADVGDLMALR
jgi:hypothetical protein